MDLPSIQGCKHHHFTLHVNAQTPNDWISNMHRQLLIWKYLIEVRMEPALYGYIIKIFNYNMLTNNWALTGFTMITNI